MYSNFAKTKNGNMSDKLMDTIGQLMGLRYKSHPWHGADIGKETPEVLTCFVEMLTTDTIKL